MPREEREQERSFELMSERARSVVGEVPSALTRYGIVVIGAVLLILLGVMYALPYREVFSGVAVLRSEPVVSADSVEVVLGVRFASDRPLGGGGGMLRLEGSEAVVSGRMVELSDRRDTLGFQEARSLFVGGEIEVLRGDEVDFVLTRSSGTLLGRLLGGGSRN